MTDGEGMMDEKASNSCCVALNNKYTKLLEKYKKHEDMKNKLRDCLDMVTERYDSIEKENQTLKKDLEESKAHANIWKQEKEKESGIRADLETQVLALNNEIHCLKQNIHTGSQEASQQLQERCIMAEKHIKDMKALLDEERTKASLERKNAQLEKNIAGEALKKAEVEKKKASEAQKLANAQRKKIEESECILKNLKIEMDAMKSMLDLEKKKADKALKELQIGKKVATEAQKLINLDREKSDEHNLALEKLKKDIGSVKSLLALEKSNSEALVKNARQEKENARREKERADLAVAKAKELKKAAELNLKKATFEKDRTDNVHKKLEEALAKGLDEKLGKCICFKRSSEAQADGSSNVGVTFSANNAYGDMLKSDSSASHMVDKVSPGNENIIICATKHAGSEKRKHNKFNGDKESHNMLGTKKKKPDEQLSVDAELYKVRVQELQKESDEHVSFNSPLMHNVFSETDTVRLLRKQLKLEKMLVRHAKKASKVEALRNDMLHREVFNIKQEYLFLQQRVFMLEKSIFNRGEGMPPSVKIGNGSCSRETIYSADCRSHIFSGTDSRLEPPYSGSSNKMLHPSAINPSLAFFSEPTFMGSQERDPLFIPSLANMGEGISNLKQSLSKFSDRGQHEYNENEPHVKSDGCRSSLLNDTEMVRLGNLKRNGAIDGVDSVKDFCSEGERFHECTSSFFQKEILLHGILDGKQDEHGGDTCKKMSCRRVPKFSKRRKISSGGLLVIDGQEDYQVRNKRSNKGVDHLLPSVPPRSSMMEQCLKDTKKNAPDSHHYATEGFDKMATFDYMKLLDLDDDTEENAYRDAIAIPVSPSLPHVEFNWDDKLEGDNNEIPVDDSCIENSSTVRDRLPSTSNFDIIDLPLKELQKESEVDRSKNLNLVTKEDCSVGISHEGNKLVSGTYVSGKKVGKQHGFAYASSHGAVLKCVIVVSDSKNESSILRVLQTVASCKGHCSFLHSVDSCFQRILQALLNSENLSMREKVCVFLSLLLDGINGDGQKNMPNGLADVKFLDLVSGKIYSALKDPVLGRMFMESIDFYELHDVIEYFILHGKLLVYDGVPQLKAPSIPKIDVILNKGSVTLYEVVAPSYLLISSGHLLAAVCLAIDQISFICEMSCNIITQFKSDPAVLLAILHVFARVCGSRLFTLQQYSMSMEVVKSITAVLEKRLQLVISVAPSPPSMTEKRCKNWYCSGNCPFSENAISMENAASMLLENFQKHLTSLPDYPLKLDNLAKLPAFGSSENEDAAFLGVPDEDFMDLIDNLSLIEIVASLMEWQWTSHHIVVPLCEYMDSHISSERCAVAILLLCQLGRLGLKACGYDDNGVKKLQQWLCAFIAESCFDKLSLFYQFATLDSLLCLTPLSFAEILKGRFDASANMSNRNPYELVRQWFFQLNNEQQSLFKLHQAFSHDGDESGFLFGWK